MEITPSPRCHGLLAGTPSQFGLTLTNGVSDPERGWRRIYFDGFAQDDWQLRRNLTVNLGLRYETWTSPVEVNGMMSAHIRATDPTNERGSPYLAPHLDFAPRLGVAWDPTGSGKTAIRAGGGVFFNSFDGRAYYYQATNNSDFVQAYTLVNPVFPHAPLTNLSGAQQDWSIQYRPQTPITYQYSFEVQRQLTSKINVRAAYVGSISEHLTVDVEPNIRISQPNASAPFGVFYPVGAPLTNPLFSTMQQIDTEGIANYNGLQTQIQKTFSAGFQMTLSYTFSRTLSDADQIVNGQQSAQISPIPEFPLSVRGDYHGLSALDQMHTLVWNGSYNLPFDKGLNSGVAKAILGGWSLNGIFSYGSGRPMSIATGFNQSRDVQSTFPDRPNLAPGFTNNPTSGVTQGCGAIAAGQTLGSVGLWYNPCAFQLEPAGEYGNLGHDTVIAPGITNADASLVKDTKINERMRLEFRAEFFNLANHKILGLPTLSVFSSNGLYTGNSGKITTTVHDNRELQLGMKLIF